MVSVMRASPEGPFMVTEMFANPKPILGLLRLGSLPGSPNWSGQLATLLTRAEQEATALASGGVDGILIEAEMTGSDNDTELVAFAAACLTRIISHVRHLTHLPLGLSVLPNRPELAMSVAQIAEVAFIRVPLLLGSVVGETQVASGALNRLLGLKNRVGSKPVSIWADLSPTHWLPGQPPGLVSEESNETLKREIMLLANSARQCHYPNALLIQDTDISPVLLDALVAETSLPLVVLNMSKADQTDQYYRPAAGIVLEAGVRKPLARVATSSGAIDLPTVDMHRIEDMVRRLRHSPGIDAINREFFIGEGAGKPTAS